MNTEKFYQLIKWFTITVLLIGLSVFLIRDANAEDLFPAIVLKQGQKAPFSGALLDKSELKFFIHGLSDCQGRLETCLNIDPPFWESKTFIITTLVAVFASGIVIGVSAR